MPTGEDYRRMLIANELMGNRAQPVELLPMLPDGGIQPQGQVNLPQNAQQPQQSGFNFMEDGSMRGVLGGIGREGGGALGAGFGSLFGSGPNNAVDFGGGNQFIPGQGFMQQAQGPVTKGGQVPMAGGFDFNSFFSGLF